MRNVWHRCAALGALSALSVSSILYTSDAAAEASKTFRYETPVTLFNGDFRITSTQVLITLDTASLIRDGKLDADGSDLRILDSTGKLLPHFIESGLDTSATRIWVRVPELAGLADTSLSVLSGNPGAADASNPAQTFDLWDDFNESSGIWQESCGKPSLTLADGKGQLQWEDSGMYVASKGGPNGDGSFPTSDTYIVEVNGTFHQQYPALRWLNADFNGYTLLHTGTDMFVGASTEQGSACAGASFHGTRTTVTNPAGIYGAVWTESSTIGFSPVDRVTLLPDGLYPRTGNLRLVIGGVMRGTGAMQLDWVRVRRYHRTEPNVSFGDTVERATPTTPSIQGITASETDLTVAFEYAGTSTEAFSVRCGAHEASGSASPIVVSGLDAGKAYDCTVSIDNELGETLVSQVQTASTLGGSTGGDGDGSAGGDGDGDGSVGGDGDSSAGGDGDGDDSSNPDEGKKSSGGGCSVPDQGASLSSALLMGLALLFSRRRKHAQR